MSKQNFVNPHWTGEQLRTAENIHGNPITLQQFYMEIQRIN